MRRCSPIFLICIAVLFQGCDAKDEEERTVYTDASTQSMLPYSEEDSEDEPGLEGMDDDNQGVIFF